MQVRRTWASRRESARSAHGDSGVDWTPPQLGRDSAQPDEYRLADAGYSLDGVGGDPEFGRPLEQRSEFVGVCENVTRIVDGHPLAPILLDEIALHILNLTPDLSRWACDNSFGQ